MELQNLPYGIVIFSIVCIALVLGIIMVSDLETNFPQSVGTQSETFLGDNATNQTLAGEAITSFSATRYNNTWLDFDGTNDYLLIYPSTNDTLSFWYNSSTSGGWQYVTNVGGVKYTNGSLADPVEYPVYFNGTHYFFGKTDATTFWGGSIDEIRIYDGFLNETEITTLYNEDH